MKKVVVIMVTLCLVLTMCVGVSAEGSATIGVDAVNYGRAGEKVTVPVYIRNADALAAYGDNLAGIEILFKFDDTQLSLVGVDSSSVLTYIYTDKLGEEKTGRYSAKCELSPQGSTNSFRLMLDADAESCKDVRLEGDIKLANVVFKIKDGISEGTVIKLTYEVIAASDSNDPAKKFGDKFDKVEIAAITLNDPVVDSGGYDPDVDSPPPVVEEPDDPTTTTSGVDTVSTSSKASTTNPKTGDTGVLAVGALLAFAVGAALITIKKR